MKSSTSTNRISAPMSKRTTFTSITPLPPNISRAAIVEFLHNYETMIDINPLVTDRYRIPPPPDADPDEANCVWYQLTDAVVMPWNASSPTSTDGTTTKPKSSNVSYTCAFHPLPDGLQTHCRAPLGVDIRDSWTVGGTAPGEPRQPVELGLAELGAPATGLYLREDVDLRCNRLMAGFVKKTLKKSHESVVQKLNSDLSNASMVVSPTEQRARSSSNGSNKVEHSSPATTTSSVKQRPVSMGSPLHTQRPPPYRVYPGKQQQWSQAQHPAVQTAPLVRKQSPPRRYVAPQIPPQMLQLPQLPQQQQHSYRQHQYAHSYSYSHRVPVPVPVAPGAAPAPVQAHTAITRKSVPTALSVGPPPSSQQQPQVRQTQLQNQQQYQQHQRSLHPYFPQMNGADNHIPVDLSSLSSSPSMSSSSSLPTTGSTTPSSVSTAPTAVSTPASSPGLSTHPSPPTIPYDRFKMTASPLTRLQLQLPKVATNFNSNDAVQAGRELYTEKEQRHSLYQQLLPPLTFSAREVVASEPRRKSTGSDATAFANSNGATSGIAGLPLHDLSLCPQPLRIGGNRRASAEQVPQVSPPPKKELPKELPKYDLPKAFERVELVESVAATAPSIDDTAQPILPTQESIQKTIEEAMPEPVQVGATEYPALNPYEYNEDDYEDIYVDSPILASDAHDQHKGPYSPTVFAEMDGGSSVVVAPLASVVSGEKAKSGLPDWRERRRFLAGDDLDD